MYACVLYQMTTESINDLTWKGSLPSPLVTSPHMQHMPPPPPPAPHGSSRGGHSGAPPTPYGVTTMTHFAQLPGSAYPPPVQQGGAMPPPQSHPRTHHMGASHAGVGANAGHFMQPIMGASSGAPHATNGVSVCTFP